MDGQIPEAKAMKGPDPKPENDQRDRIRICVALTPTGSADMKYWPPVAYQRLPMKLYLGPQSGIIPFGSNKPGNRSMEEVVCRCGEQYTWM